MMRIGQKLGFFGGKSEPHGNLCVHSHSQYLFVGRLSPRGIDSVDVVL
jgi:hypothetical protein